MEYNGCPDSEVLAEHLKKWKYDPKRKEEVLNKLNPYGNSSKEVIQKCEELNKRAWRKPKMKTQLLKILGDWQDVVDDCRATVSKPPLGKEPSTKFKKSILISEHSPIRDIIFRWKWSGIKSWVATHWVRHHWECRVSTQRNDRQDKYDRNKAPQDAPVDFVGQANTQSLIDTERKRLCTMAAKETREQAEDLKCTIHEVQPEIGDVLVPNCIYRGGCPEGENNCHWYDHLEHGFLARHPEITPYTTLQERYDIYNKEFYEQH